MVEERLHDAKLAWLRRRRKTLVALRHLQPRVDYCLAVKRKHASTLKKWAYTDGTTFYLDRTEVAHESTLRAALGSRVWRRSDNADALYDDCIGPSAYNKAQGLPVRVWGMLACGVLRIEVLAEGEVMDRVLYTELVEDKFEDWCGTCEYVVCDYESCLRTPEALHALFACGLQLVEEFPRCSQDFNAIENAWKILKDRLDETVPVELERRDSFITRLNAAVRWMNRTRRDQLRYLSDNQKERADECLAKDPKGGRTQW